MLLLTPPRYLRLATAALLLSATVFVALPWVLRLVDPTAGSFHIDTLNALALGAVLLAGTLHLGFFAFRELFPRFYEYQIECVEEAGKMFENLTLSLETEIGKTFAPSHERLNALAEKRKIAQFKFHMRCVRFFACFLVLAYLLWLAQDMVKVAMLAVPGSAPAL